MQGPEPWLKWTNPLIRGEKCSVSGRLLHDLPSRCLFQPRRSFGTNIAKKNAAHNEEVPRKEKRRGNTASRHLEVLFTPLNAEGLVCHLPQGLHWVARVAESPGVPGCGSGGGAVDAGGPDICVCYALTPWRQKRFRNGDRILWGPFFHAES